MIEEKWLGKRVNYPQAYTPEILVAVPRTLNREIYQIHQPEILFTGFDSWHAYEVSFLLKNGMPLAGVLKIVYPADSPYLIESKSLKLYLGSFNMERLGETSPEAASRFIHIVEQDLSRLLQTAVKAVLHLSQPANATFDFTGYHIIEEEINPEQIQFSVYQEHPDFLTENKQDGAGKEIRLGSHLLKSNCKITSQPDWGSVYLHMKGVSLPAPVSFLKYIVSLRNENHFHEEICEMIFKRLTDLFQPEILMVCCLYTRRGGIDICPARANRPAYLPSFLGDPLSWTPRAFRQ